PVREGRRRRARRGARDRPRRAHRREVPACRAGLRRQLLSKDTLALLRTAEQFGAPLRIVQSTVEVNEARKRRMADKVIAACGGSVEGKTVAGRGRTGKPENDGMAHRPALGSLPARCSARAT